MRLQRSPRPHIAGFGEGEEEGKGNGERSKGGDKWEGRGGEEEGEERRGEVCSTNVNLF